jgi:hypothetical protein
MNMSLVLSLVVFPIAVMAAEVFESAQDLNGTWACTTYAARNNGDARCVKSGDLLFTKQGNLTFNAETKTWSYAGASANDGFEGCRDQLASSGKYDVQSNNLVLVGQMGIAVYPLVRTTATTFSGNQYALHAFFVCKKNQ